MGSRGSKSGIQVGKHELDVFEIEEKYDYHPKYGYITRFEAGVLYKNVKQGNVEALPELTRQLYKEADEYTMWYTAQGRYRQDAITYYDPIYHMTSYLLDGQYEKAQKEIYSVQAKLIISGGKKSPWLKYQNQLIDIGKKHGKDEPYYIGGEEVKQLQENLKKGNK